MVRIHFKGTRGNTAGGIDNHKRHTAGGGYGGGWMVETMELVLMVLQNMVEMVKSKQLSWGSGGGGGGGGWFGGGMAEMMEILGGGQGGGFWICIC